jgi:RNA polymerase sigma-70 factor (ECF subfamily)
LKANVALEHARAAESLDDFDAVYEAYYQQVYRAVRAIVLDPGLAEDVTQNTFLKAYRHRDRYKPTGSLGGWLHRIAVREAITILRWRKVHDRLIGAITLHISAPHVDPPTGDVVGQLLRKLNPGTRAAVILFYFHGYRYREVASMLRIPEGTVATRISNGLRQMRRVVDGQ